MNKEEPRAEAIRLFNDPVEYFSGSHEAMQRMSREDVASLQEEGLKYRFETLVDHVPMLNRLSSKQDIRQLDSIDDAVPLLFEHTMYKAYPPILLQKGRFADINKFISRLTTFDLADVDVSHCKTIDDWFDVLDAETGLEICHSSGTSGTMSFNPTSKREQDKFIRELVAAIKDRSDGSDEPWYVVHPYFRSGGSAHLRPWTSYCEYLADGDESRLITAYPTRMSSDVLYMAAKIRAAKAQGNLDRLEVNPELMGRLKEFEALQKEMPNHLNKFFTQVLNDLRGKRVYIGGTWNILHNFSKEGLAEGQEGVFSPGSVVMTGGGAKGMTPPENWKRDVCRFMGINDLIMTYGTSEVCTLHYLCEHGHYHLSPTAITYVLDPDTSELLPRKGKVTGRAAFYDLCAETRWGGFITGDEITVNWKTNVPVVAKALYRGEYRAL